MKAGGPRADDVCVIQIADVQRACRRGTHPLHRAGENARVGLFISNQGRIDYSAEVRQRPAASRLRSAVPSELLTTASVSPERRRRSSASGTRGMTDRHSRFARPSGRSTDRNSRTSRSNVGAGRDAVIDSCPRIARRYWLKDPCPEQRHRQRVVSNTPDAMRLRLASGFRDRRQAAGSSARTTPSRNRSRSACYRHRGGRCRSGRKESRVKLKTSGFVRSSYDEREVSSHLRRIPDDFPRRYGVPRRRSGVLPDCARLRQA